MEKQPIKQSEAKILIYLSVVHNTRKHVTAIAHKLEIDYSYCMRVLQSMVAKGWLKKHAYKRHMFYNLTEWAPIDLAQRVYLDSSFQRDLEQNCTIEESIEKTPRIEEKQPLNEDTEAEERESDIYDKKTELEMLEDRETNENQ